VAAWHGNRGRVARRQAGVLKSAAAPGEKWVPQRLRPVGATRSVHL